MTKINIIYVVFMLATMLIYFWAIYDLRREKKRFKKAIRNIKEDLTDEVMGLDPAQERAIEEIIKKETRFFIL